MASSTIRKAIGAVKDQTSISLAKVTGNVAPDLEVLVVKATTHDNEAADDKYAKEILNLMSCSRINVNACVFAVSKRLSKTSDWIVALKVLVLVHKLLNEGGIVFRQEMLFASRRGGRVLNMASFRDDPHSSSWDQSSFVRAYVLYLDQKLETVAYGRKNLSVGDDGEGYGRDEDGFRRAKSCDDLSDSRRERNVVMWLKDLSPERVLERLNQLLRLLDRFLACRPTGAARSTRMVLVALHLLVRDSFGLYDDICNVLKYLLVCFSDLEYAYTIKAFDAYVNAAKMIVDLSGFYDWVREVGMVRASEFPQVEKISDQLLGSLEGLLREKADRPKSPKEEGSFSHINDEREVEGSMSEVKALPPPEPRMAQDLVNLDDGVSVDQESNKLALSLFSEWVEFPENGEGKVSSTSAWENPAAERGKADWEAVLVESASNLSMQQAEMGGGLDPLLLNGMYDQGAVKQHVEASRMSGGSASSVALNGGTAEVLSLPPAPDHGQQDPFAASLLVPPPSYVQIADLERKRELLTQEQQLWQRYASNGTQGQLISAMPYAMPQHVGLGQQQGAYY
ncbi:probable clathrin assembly protein At4g32285 [Salvia miltiorrhiza]|uniref:probable clathrin assembly protein At4g32285 n=1 Tax=Salvia miltiorrhiza TaxID=226208 RepID=UPI0025AB9420|nr:probable clathrin assembly protein At4g32285 [Salvia miltiorrhiza]